MLQCHAHMSALLRADPALVSWEYHLKRCVFRSCADEGECRDACEGERSCAQQYYVEGYVDDVCPQHIYEFKCVQHLTVEHVLQLYFYMWMWDHMPQSWLVHGLRVGKLVNVRDNQIVTLRDEPFERRGDAPELSLDAKGMQPLHRTATTHAVEHILHSKFGTASSVSDDELISRLCSS